MGLSKVTSTSSVQDDRQLRQTATWTKQMLEAIHTILCAALAKFVDCVCAILSKITKSTVAPPEYITKTFLNSGSEGQGPGQEDTSGDWITIASLIIALWYISSLRIARHARRLQQQRPGIPIGVVRPIQLGNMRI